MTERDEIPDQVRDDGVLCFAADVELVDVFGHVGIRYDFRATGAVADELADKGSVLEDRTALAFGAMDIDKPRGKRGGDDLGFLSGYINGLRPPVVFLCEKIKVTLVNHQPAKLIIHI